MSVTRRKYEEPVFYFCLNDEGSFLDALFITKDSIILHPSSKIPARSGKIEFSFPFSDIVVSCEFVLESKSRDVHLRFKKMKLDDRAHIENFISGNISQLELSLEALI